MFQEDLNDAREQMEGEREQKIFPASTVHGNVVYGITGSAYNDDKSFSIMDECQRAALAKRPV